MFPDIREFYSDFRVLHTQLREGDRLEIRIETHHDPEDEKWWRMPGLNAYFVPKIGDERSVLECGTWEGLFREKTLLLYND